MPVFVKTKSKPCFLLFPTDQINTNNLNRKSLQLSKYEIIMISFDKKQQQDMIATWEQPLQQLLNTFGSTQVDFIELCIYKPCNWIKQMFYYDNLKRQYKENEQRQHIYPLFVPQEELMKKLDLRSDQTIFILLIDRDRNGLVLYQTNGYCNQQKLEILQKILFEKIPQEPSQEQPSLNQPSDV